MQSKMLNIPSYIEDPSYRYKMPALQLKIEGRGNGIKTKIVNLNELATALRVPPAYPLKFLGHELGSQTNDKQDIINGSFNEPEMRRHLDKFIEKYVLCSSCKYPEMVLKIKHGVVGGTCNSCGHRSQLDNAHKIAAYILKNPPKNSSEFKGDKDKKDEKDDKKGKGDKEDKKPKHDKDGHHDKKDDKKEEKKHEEEKTDSKEKGEKVVKEVAAPVLTVTFKDVEEDLIQKVKQVYQQYSSIQNFDDNPEEVKKIVEKAKEIVTDEYLNKLPYILFNAIFGVNIAKEIAKNKAILHEAYKVSQIRDHELDTLLSLEKLLLVKLASNNLEKYIPTIVKLFYDEDLMEEDFLLDWDSGKLNSRLIMDWRYQRPIDERFKAASRPIIKWLKEEEDDEEEAAVEPVAAALGNDNKKEDEGEDSDIDIDNI